MHGRSFRHGETASLFGVSSATPESTAFGTASASPVASFSFVTLASPAYGVSSVSARGEVLAFSISAEFAASSVTSSFHHTELPGRPT